MSFRNPHAGKPPYGPSAPESECRLLPLVARMAVDRPEGLGREPWATHLRTCAGCYEEAAGHTRSVAVFRAVEGTGRANRVSALTWETFLGVLEEQRVAEEQARNRARWAIPLAAIAAGVLGLTGILGWDGLQEETPAPARIVQVQPPEQRSMEELVRWTLEAEGRHGDRILTVSDAPNRLGVLGAEGLHWNVPDAQQIAASIAPREADGLAMEPISTASSRNLPPPNAIEHRVPPTQPAIERSGGTQPLFRLEHRILSTQAVSFPARE